MRHRSWAAALLALVAILASEAGAQNIGLSSVCDGSTIRVSFAGVFPSDRPFLILWRRNASECGPWTALGFYPNTGQNMQFETVDSDVTAGKLYLYRLGLGENDQIWPLPFGGQSVVFESWTGCGAAPIGHGVLYTVEYDNSVYLVPSGCAGTCYPSYIIWNSQVDLSPYANQEIPVKLYGSAWWYWQSGWVLTVDAVTSAECVPVAVQPTTWSDVKVRYR